MAQVFYRGYHTESISTPIIEGIPGVATLIPRLTTLSYTCGATAHKLYVMPALGSTTTTRGVNGGSTVPVADIDLTKDATGADESLAANDYIGWTDENGVFQFDKIISVSSNDIQVSALPSDIDDGATVWGFYEPGRFTQYETRLPASTTTVLRDVSLQGGMSPQLGALGASLTGSGSPILIYIDNLTAAGNIDYLSGYYTDSGSVNR